MTVVWILFQSYPEQENDVSERNEMHWIKSLFFIFHAVCNIYFFRRQKLAEKEEFTKSKASSSLLSGDSSDLAGVGYRPKTRETKSTYEVLLSFLQAAIGDQVSCHQLLYSKNLKAFDTCSSVPVVICNVFVYSHVIFCVGLLMKYLWLWKMTRWR